MKYCDNYLDPCNEVITDEVAEYYANKGQYKQYCTKCLIKIDGTGKRIFGRMPMNGFGEDVLEWIKSIDDSILNDKITQQIMNIAQKNGLVKLVAYDPEKHGVRNVKPGDKIWQLNDGFTR